MNRKANNSIEGSIENADKSYKPPNRIKLKFCKGSE